MPNMREKTDEKLTFAEIYTDICLRYGICPQKSIKNYSEDGILNLRADRIKTEDWKPLLESFDACDGIKYFALRNQSQTTVAHHQLTDADKKLKSSVNRKEISNKLCNVIKKWLVKKSKVFECLVLENLILSEDNIKILSEGLAENSGLKYLSFEKCRLGNKHFQTLCQAIRHSSSIQEINFSGCNLTWRAADDVVNLIKQQNSVRHVNIWQNSLRYQICHLEKIGGLNGINLSHNPAFGDKGIQILAKSLTGEDNICVKEIYFRHCGITDDGAKVLLKFLDSNTSFSWIDIEENSLQNESFYKEVSEKCQMKLSLEKWERKFMPQIIVLVDPKQKPIFKTGLANRGTTFSNLKYSSCSSQSKLTEMSDKLKTSNAELNAIKEQLAKNLEKLEDEKREHLKTKQNLQRILLEIGDLNQMKTEGKQTLDDSVLTAIEATFKKFQDFISLLRTAELENFVKVPQITNADFIHRQPYTDFPYEGLHSNYTNERNWISLQKHVNSINK